jgi:hypothetical protein
VIVSMAGLRTLQAQPYSPDFPGSGPVSFGFRTCLPLRGSSGISPDSLFTLHRWRDRGTTTISRPMAPCNNDLLWISGNPLHHRGRAGQLYRGQSTSADRRLGEVVGSNSATRVVRFPSRSPTRRVTSTCSSTTCGCTATLWSKVGKFRPEYAGKLNFHLSAVHGELRTKRDEPTIGLLLCESHEGAIVEYPFKEIGSPIDLSSYRVPRELPPQVRGELPSSPGSPRRCGEIEV